MNIHIHKGDGIRDLMDITTGLALTYVFVIIPKTGGKKDEERQKTKIGKLISKKKDVVSSSSPSHPTP